MMDRTHDGKPFRMLCVIDEFTRECLAIRVERKLNARIVLETLADLFLFTGRRNTSVRTMVLNLSRRRYADGSNGSACRRSSNLAAHGKTAIARASTRNFAMSFSPARSSTR